MVKKIKKSCGEIVKKKKTKKNILIEKPIKIMMMWNLLGLYQT